jgi:hypothetical protein
MQFATLHTYADQWGMSADGGYKWLGENYFKDRKELASSLGKPIIYEEYGMMGQGKQERQKVLRQSDDLFGYIIS